MSDASKSDGPAPDHTGPAHHAAPAGRAVPADGPAPADGEPGGHAAPTDPAAAPGGATGPAAGSSALRQLVGEDFSVAESIGGWRGVAESVAPGVVFVAVFVATRDLAPALVASLAIAVVATVLRLVQRTPVTQALGGLLGVVVGVVWAWQSGRAEDYFAMGLWTNAAYLVALLVALALRWPVVGVVVALLRGHDMSWRTDPAQRARRGRYTLATWLWVAMFALRLVVQLPLYLDAEVAWLGTARIVMGLPLWGLTLWATWLLVREPASAEAR